eukprot:g39190.t1
MVGVPVETVFVRVYCEGAVLTWHGGCPWGNHSPAAYLLRGDWADLGVHSPRRRGPGRAPQGNSAFHQARLVYWRPPLQVRRPRGRRQVHRKTRSFVTSLSSSPSKDYKLELWIACTLLAVSVCFTRPDDIVALHLKVNCL